MKSINIRLDYLENEFQREYKPLSITINTHVIEKADSGKLCLRIINGREILIGNGVIIGRSKLPFHENEISIYEEY